MLPEPDDAVKGLGRGIAKGLNPVGLYAGGHEGVYDVPVCGRETKSTLDMIGEPGQEIGQAQAQGSFRLSDRGDPGRARRKESPTIGFRQEIRG